MWHVLLHWLQLHSKRNSSSLFLALLLLFRSFCLWSYSLKKNRLFFCSVKHEATEATLQQGDTYTDMKKISKGRELVFLSLKSIRVLSLTSRGVDSEMNAFKNPSAKRRFFLLLLPGIFLSILSSNFFNKFLLNVIQHRHIFNWNFQNARSMC